MTISTIKGALIGSLPTSQGAWPLFEKLKAQVEPHLPKPEPQTTN